MNINTKWFKLLGLFLDIVGTVIIGLAVLNLHTHLRRLNRRELEEDLQKQLQRENYFTIVGISLIFVGFVLIFGEEVYTSLWKKSKVGKK